MATSKKPRNTAARLKALEKLLKDRRPRGGLERAAIRRQQQDLEEGHRRGLVWDEEEAQRAIAFFSMLKHWKGALAGKTFVPESWQTELVIAPLFGWKTEDGKRRFRKAYIELARKNGKTFLAAGIGLQGLIADREQGAEVYCAATKRDQALIVFRDAKNCLGPELKKLVKIYTGSITFERLNGSFRPLGSDHDTTDGLNVSRAIVDELHAHKNRGMWDVLDGATGAREQPLLAAITTAGMDRTTICWEIREIARGTLEGRPNHNDAFFALICCAEEKDDWESPETWRKANPNLGISVLEKDLADKAKNAKASGSAENNFKRKHLNLWVSGVTKWISVQEWDKGLVSVPREMEATQECFTGIDLGWRDDFAAQVNVFPERIALAAPAAGDDEEQPEEREEKEGEESAEDKRVAVARCKIRKAWIEAKFWVPEEGKRDIYKDPLATWIRDGLVNVTPGNATDIDAILDSVIGDADRYLIKEVSVDPNNARQFGQDLMKSGIAVWEFWQSHRNYNEPCREFERLAAAGLIQHADNDLMRWMIGNVVMEMDSRGCVMPSKRKAPEKIDGPVAALMAFARAMFTELDNGSVYESRGMLVL